MTCDHIDNDDYPVSSQRSRIMRSVRQKDTSPEMKVRSALHAAGLRYRLHVKGLPGTPDLVFPRRKVVVFVHGCFWHRHPGCHLATTPKSRGAFWTEKFRRNRERDAAAAGALRSRGWAVVEVWECEIKRNDYLEPLLQILRLAIDARMSQPHRLHRSFNASLRRKTSESGTRGAEGG
ncbi:MAG: DNA mismatch endonuclease Vsr [Mesorhizobium sp.]|nr:MAG: DNA mismatch endonuclease Vsr [Mesorhizobium sp.]